MKLVLEALIRYGIVTVEQPCGESSRTDSCVGDLPRGHLIYNAELIQQYKMKSNPWARGASQEKKEDNAALEALITRK